MRKSIQRNKILEFLQNTTSHPSAEEVFEVVRLVFPKLSLATVYRNLEQLKAHGLIIELPGKVKRYDANVIDHHHLYCKECGAVRDFGFMGLENEIKRLDAFSEDNQVQYRIEFIGYCEDCKLTKMAKAPNTRRKL